MKFKLKKKFKLILIFIIFIFIILLILYKIDSTKNDPFMTIQDLGLEKKSIDSIDRDRLVDLLGFNYSISNDICKRQQDNKTFLGLLIITSYVGNDNVRSAHRAAISQLELNNIGFLRIFLIAKIPQKDKFINQHQIEDEQKHHGDLLQGNFLEAYRNLTYKHIMGLSWAAKNCDNTKFIVKIDDDTVFDIYHLQKYLQNFVGSTNFIAGYILDNKIPIRIMANKWFVTYEEYEKKIFPDYVSGWLYITTPEVAKHLVIQSQKENFFWIDDTFITGIIREKLKIPIIRVNDWFSANSEFLDCCINDIKKISYKCDYYVGPNGGDSKLITKFTKTIRKCYEKKKCKSRSIGKELKKTCVGYKKDLLNDHGEALVRSIKL